MNTLLNGLKKKASRTMMRVEKRSPEILMIGGIVAMALALVEASRAILKVEAIIDDHNERLQKVEEARRIVESGETEVAMTVMEYRQAKAMVYAKTGWEFGKLYASTIASTTLSLACFITSRNILNKRYLGAVAAYNAVTEVFNTYRKRVVDEYGPELDRHLRYGTVYGQETITEVDENGKKVKKKVDTETVDTTLISPQDTSRWFDESNKHWDPNPSFSMFFLRTQQSIMNDKLHSRGHVLLNDVYEALGFPRTPYGAIAGWVDGKGDSCIDFGIYDPDKEVCRKFVNGTANAILLEFNHDGVIWEEI